MFVRLSYQKLADELNQAGSWFVSIGINIDGSRLETIIDTVNLINEHHKKGTLNQLIEQEGNQKLWYCLAEADDFIPIYRAFSKIGCSLPIKKLKEIIRGPLYSNEEVAGNANVNPRSYSFELELTAKLAEKGFNIVGYDDIRFKYRNYDLNVQCKRIFKESLLEERLQHASDQLKARFSRDSDRGMIAISVEKIFDEIRENRYLNVDSPEAAEHEILKLMKGFIDNNRRSLFQFRNKRILGVFLFLKFNALVGSTISRGVEIHCLPIVNPDWQLADYNLFRELSAKLFPQTGGTE